MMGRRNCRRKPSCYNQLKQTRRDSGLLEQWIAPKSPAVRYLNLDLSWRLGESCRLCGVNNCPRMSFRFMRSHLNSNSAATQRTGVYYASIAWIVFQCLIVAVAGFSPTIEEMPIDLIAVVGTIVTVAVGIIVVRCVFNYSRWFAIALLTPTVLLQLSTITIWLSRGLN